MKTYEITIGDDIVDEFKQYLNTHRIWWRVINTAWVSILYTNIMFGCSDDFYIGLVLKYNCKLSHVKHVNPAIVSIYV